MRDNRAYDGLNGTDVAVLSISVDRPTFFNFLNPNRSFFLNFQMFFSYLSDYKGGGDEQDGMWPVAGGRIDTRMVFTFFTGYFQDRLQPQASFIYDPPTGGGAIIARLSYRWNESFSTIVGITNLYGRPVQTQQAYFPIALRGSADTTSEAFRPHLGLLRNRDGAFVTVRYSW